MKNSDEMRQQTLKPFEIKKELGYCHFGYVEPSGAQQIAKNALDYILRLESQVPRWISVEERLPKLREKVVVTDGVHTWDYGEFSGLSGNAGRRDRWYWKHNSVRTVKWWMPKKTALPEPPAKEA